MTTSTRLDANLSWREVLQELGCNTSANSLPVIVACPTCQGKLAIHHDSLGGGYWHYCFGCNSYGDMVELCSKIWRLDTSATLHQLRRRGFRVDTLDVVEIDKYRHWRDQINQVELLWQGARNRAASEDTASLRQFRAAHSLYLACSRSSWMAGPAKYLGTLTYGMLPASLRPKKGESKKYKNGGAVLALPSYDLPGRIRAYHVLYPDGETAIWRTEVYDRTDPKNRDTGVTMLGAPYETSRKWGSQVLVMTSPLWSLRFQLRQFHSSTKPLPIVCCGHNPSPDDAVWEVLRGRKLVFWNPRRDQPDAVALRLAMQLGASVVTSDAASDDGVIRLLSEGNPEAPLKRLFEAARPWNVAIQDLLRSLPQAQTEAMLLQMETDGCDLEQVAQHCTNADSLRVLSTLSSGSPWRRLQYNGNVILERDCAWWKEKKNGPAELICDAILRIDQVVHHLDTEEVYYRGRVRYQGEETLFCEPRQVIDRKPLHWLQDFLLKRQIGFLRFNPSWNSHAVSIACQLHKPETSRGLQSAGYSSDQGFLFKYMKILPGGRIEPMDRPIGPGTCPGPKRESVEPAAAEVLRWLSQNDPASIAAVAFVAAVAGNVIAPAVSETPQSIGIETETLWGLCSRIAHELGCVSDSLWPSQTIYTHHWPMIDSGSDNKFRMLSDHGWIQQVPRSQVLEKLLTQEWTMLCNASNELMATSLPDNFDTLLPAYLQNLSERNFRLKAHRLHYPGFTEVVLADFVKWLNGLGAEVKLDRPRRWIWESNDREVGQLVMERIVEATLDNKLAPKERPEGMEVRLSRAIKSHPALVNVPFDQAMAALGRTRVLVRMQGHGTCVFRKREWLQAMQNVFANHLKVTSDEEETA